MAESVDKGRYSRLAIFRITAAVALGLLALVALLLAFFPWDLLREPLNRYASERMGRSFEITRRLEVHPGFTTRITFHGVQLANPEWAARPHLLKAERADFSIRLWPLLRGKIDLPELSLQRPQIALQMEPDGRRTWSLGSDTKDEGAVPAIGALRVDEGHLHYQALADGADIGVEFSVDSSAADKMPLHYKARGTWRQEPFDANGRTGGVLQLNASAQSPFPIEIAATAGQTSLKARGTVASLANLDDANATFDLRGQSLADLYKLLGVVLPETPAYALQGQLAKQADIWKVSKIQGRLGSSDLVGNLVYDRSRPQALLSGKVQSEMLDFNDLGPLVGLQTKKKVLQDHAPVAAKPAAPPASKPPQPSEQEMAVAAVQSAPPVQNAPAARLPGERVLPAAVLDVQRLKAMDADVWYSATRVRHAQALPVDRLSAHIQLQKGVLRLEPLQVGLAGGQVAGLIHIDGNMQPAAVKAKLDARLLQLNQLFPTVQLTRGSLGKLNGHIDLQGRGNSTARMLGSSEGQVAMLMGRGEISNMLLEVLGLDGGEIVKFLLRGDRNIELRCAAAAFEVKQGVMTTKSIVLDTADTIVQGQGHISLANETLDLMLHPAPKDGSILSLRSPLRIGGTFAAPSAGPDKTALAGRVGLAVALGAINPLLALAATVETGPGKDADCQRVLSLAGAPAAKTGARP
jgi:AsmA family protein